MQKIQVIGNIVRDAVVRDTNGRKAINFVVAVNKSYKDKEGVKHEKATFYSCTQWRESTQSVEVTKYLTKGIKVFVEGEPSAEMYQTKEGKQAIDNRINIGFLQLLTFAEKAESSTNSSAVMAETVAENVDDLPF